MRPPSSNHIRILITGFGPFGNVVNNPSGRIVRRLMRDSVKCAEAKCRVLTVSYSKVDKVLPLLLANGDFDVALLLGVAGRENQIRIERYAINRDTAKARDVDNRIRRDRAIKRSACTRIETQADSKGIQDLMKRNGIRSRISKDAGGFLCNHAYYVAQETISRLGLKTVCLFVHVPPDRFATKEIKPKRSMPLGKQYRAVRMIAECLCDAARSQKR